MTNQEFVYWRAYYNLKAKLEEEASKPKKSGAVSSQEFKQMMGNRKVELPSKTPSQ